MQQPTYNNVNSFSDSSFEYDEFSNGKFYRGSEFSTGSPDEGQLFRRWFLNIIEIPNTLTNRLKDWLRVTPGSRGSTSDKSSGTNSIGRDGRTHRQQTANPRGDYEKYNSEHFERHKRQDEGSLRNPDSMNYRRSPRNNHHHDYHIYKQNDIGIERYVNEVQRDCTTSRYLESRNERFSSSPVLILPRINPKTGEPIFHPRNYHSRPLTEDQLITHRDDNYENDNRRANIWKRNRNSCLTIEGNNIIDEFVEKDITRDVKPSQVALTRDNCENNIDDSGVVSKLEKVEFTKLTKSKDFIETISLRLRLDYESSTARNDERINNKINDANVFDNNESMNNNEIDENEHGTERKIEEFNRSGEARDFPNISALTENNVDELLKSLRERINSIDSEKLNRRDQRNAVSFVDSESDGTHEGNRLLAARWQDKSGLFANNTMPPVSIPVARPSFAERIQDIWIQEKTCIGQWVSVFDDIHRKIVSPGNARIKDGPREDSIDEEEKEITRSALNELDEKFQNETLQVSPIESTVYRHVGVQYDKRTILDEEYLCSPSLVPEFTITLRNNEERQSLRMQISQPLNDTIENNAIPSGDTIKFPSLLSPEDKTSPAQCEVNGERNFPAVVTDLHETTLDPTNKLSSSREKPSFSLNIDGTIKSQLQRRRGRKLASSLTKITRKQLAKASLRIPDWSIVNSGKIRLAGCRFSKKIRLWLANKFQSDNPRRDNASLSVDKSTNLNKFNNLKTYCNVINIFKCIDKCPSKMNVAEVYERALCRDNISSNISIEKPLRNNTGECIIEASVNETNVNNFENDEHSSISRSIDRKKIVDFRDFTDENTSCYGSMTKLSLITTISDNSINKKFRLIGSTSDTRNVVTGPRKQDPSLDESRFTEQQQPMEMPDKISPLVDSSRNRERNLHLHKILDNTGMNNVLKKSNDHSMFQRFHDKKFTALSKLETNEGKTLHRMQNKSRINISSNGRRSSMGRVKIKRDEKTIIENTGKWRETTIDKTSEPNKEGVREYLRLQRCRSMIDIVADSNKLSSMRLSSMKLNDSTMKLSSMKLNDSWSMEKRKVSRIRDIRAVKSALSHSSCESVTKNSAAARRKRIDSPFIPRRTKDSLKYRGKSLIPVCVGYTKKYRLTRQSIEKNNIANFVVNSNIIAHSKKRLSASNVMNNGSRSSSVKRTTLRDPSVSDSKKVSDHKVRFEVNINSVDKASRKINEINNDKISNDNSRNLFSDAASKRKMDDKGIVRKIKKSLENGVPLKRITIMHPSSTVSSTDSSRKRGSLADIHNSIERYKTVKSFDRVDEVSTRAYRNNRESSITRKIPRSPLEKRHNCNETIFSYPCCSRRDEEQTESVESTRNSNAVKKNHKDLPRFMKNMENPERIIDLTRIKERLDREIIERTTRTLGTEDCDCAIVLIKAINSSMELSDV